MAPEMPWDKNSNTQNSKAAAKPSDTGKIQYTNISRVICHHGLEMTSYLKSVDVHRKAMQRVGEKNN